MRLSSSRRPVLRAEVPRNAVQIFRSTVEPHGNPRPPRRLVWCDADGVRRLVLGCYSRHGSHGTCGRRSDYYFNTPGHSYFYVAPDLRATRYLYFAANGWVLPVAQLLTTVLWRRWALVTTFASLIVGVVCVLAGKRETVGHRCRNCARRRSVDSGGRSPDASATDWRRRYGDGIDVKDGVPTVYRGVYCL